MFRGLALLCLLWLPAQTVALTIEITQGAVGALPIAVVPFAWEGDAAQAPPQDVAAIVAADLGRSGRFQPLPARDMLSRPSTLQAVDFRDWRALNMENLVIGRIRPNGPGGYLVVFQLFDVYRGEQITGYSVPTTAAGLRTTAHQIADILYETLTGEPGAFATRIAFITAERQGDNQRMSLLVADADGYNEQTILTSREPLMSPAWSPDGQRLAYVSFENGRPAVWIQEVLTGRREQVASYQGINGSPAWSPDGNRLALTLSKDGNPDIFILELRTGELRALTRHWSIDTEPAWSPDGRALVFTSDRGGSPQIYRVSAAGGQPERLTFDGKYNARASYAPDGQTLTLVTQDGGGFRVGVLDLQNRVLQVLSDGALDESPSFAPNGSMIVYASQHQGRGVLAAVSVDGRIRQRLGVKRGDVREPAWSPFNPSTGAGE